VLYRVNIIICTVHQILLGWEIKGVVMGRTSSMYGMRKSYKILVGKLEGKRPFGASECRQDNNIIDLEEFDVDWIQLA
jgi:hypothetical protein